MLRILAVDDSQLITAAVGRLLRGVMPHVEVFEAQGGAAAMQLFHQLIWDIVILDISMPGENGLVLLQRMRAMVPTQPVLIVSTHCHEPYISESFRIGALGFLGKEDMPDELVPAINSALSGRPYLSKQGLALTADRHSHRHAAGS